MQIKAADDRQPDLDVLAALLERPDLDGRARRDVQSEMRRIRAGVAGEREAAYEIEFHSGAHRGRATIHDLRLNLDGRSAQMDHLLINRLLDIWVLESKHFAEGVAINDHGEWTGFSGGRAYGMASPIEQNRRHVVVLEEVFATGLVTLPKRLGIAIRPRIRPLVLVSSKARINRPRSKAAQARVEGLGTVIKADQLAVTIDRDLGTRRLSEIAQLVSEDTVQRIGRDLAALHRPISRDWAARFGLPTTLVQAGPGISSTDATLICAACGTRVSAAVIAYCEAHAERFAGRTLCYGCQRP